MCKVKSIKGWTIYLVTKDQSYYHYDMGTYLVFAPGDSPQEFCSPEWETDSLQEAIDWIKHA